MRLIQRSETNMALGSDVTLTLVSDSSEADMTELLGRLWRDIYFFERQFSRFLPVSELSVFNRSAGIEVAVTPEFRDLLLAAKNLGEETGGLYNPFILPALQRAGYTHSFVERYAADAHDDHSKKSVVGVERLKIGQSTAIIPFGTAIDLGGCGKGYLAGQLSRSIPGWVRGYWLSLGGDIVAAGHDIDRQPWQVSIQSAAQPDTICDWFVAGSGRSFAVATSGTIVRRGEKNGQAWHHIINPKTLLPATTDVQLATVCASSPLQADVFASCAVLLGSDKAPAYLKQHGATAALLQCMDGKRQSFTRKLGSEGILKNKAKEFTHA